MINSIPKSEDMPDPEDADANLIGFFKLLLEEDRRRPNLKNRTDPATEEAVLKYAVDQPAHGQVQSNRPARVVG